MNTDEIYSDKITKGSRTYFFDIKRSQNGDLYLKISESKKNASGFEHHRLMIFEEDLKDFVETLKKSLTKFEELKKPKHWRQSIVQIREKFQQAYSPWIAEDDNKLELLFFEGKKMKELVEIFGRNIGAINSRIKKLELKDKHIKLPQVPTTRKKNGS